MARLARTFSPHRHRIAVVDDDLELARSTQLLLEREGHEVRCASTPAAAVELVRSWRPELILLDYYLEYGTGADVVREVRAFDDVAQILLVTGYASEQPARALLAELDIQGFHDKADGPQRMMILVDAALKHYRSVDRVQRQSSFLRFLLDAAPEVSRIQPTHELLTAALDHVAGLLGSAPDASGLFVRFEGASSSISVEAATGRYLGVHDLSALPRGVAEAVRAGLSGVIPFAHASGLVVVPLVLRGDDRGCLLVEAASLSADAASACRIYAQLMGQALDNAVLFERATVDPLTRLYRRDFGLQRLVETLKLGARTGVPTSALLLDVDRFKQINDSRGHACGDLVLRAIAGALRDSCRTTDVLARYGGEEILAILPATDLEGARIVAERLRAAVADLRIAFEGQAIRTSASFGVATAEPGFVHVDTLLRSADRALYRAKGGGRNQVCCEVHDAVPAECARLGA